MRVLLIALCLVGVSVSAPVHAVPRSPVSAQTVSIPFDPPLGKDLSYRSERTETKNGSTTMTWSVERLRFEKVADGYRLTVEPVSNGSNEQDPAKLRVMKLLEDLTKLPYVLRINDGAQIVELEGADAYWTRIISAMRQVLAELGKGDPAEARAIAAVSDLFEKMPADARLAKLTEHVQPLVEFGQVQLSTEKPIETQIDTASPFGGTLKQDVVVSLSRIDQGFAHLAVRQSIPREELEKVVTSMLSQLARGTIEEEQKAKMNAALTALKDFRSETVSDYRVSLEDGMLEAFRSTQTISVVEGGKQQNRVKTLSLTRVR